MRQHSLVVGGTGLVGQELLRCLDASTDHRVTALVRSQPAPEARVASIHYQSFDFESPQDYENLSHQKFTCVFICLGTTRKKAGSAEAFQRVDLHYPSCILDAVRGSEPRIVLVSSVGADRPRGLYLNTKAALEAHLASLGLQHVILRPSLLLGSRKELRLAEFLGGRLLLPVHKQVQKFLPASLSQFAPVHARQVAQAMIHYGLKKKNCDKRTVVQGHDLFFPETMLARPGEEAL